MQRFVRALEWSVLLPVWREATQMRWLRVVAASGVGFVWFIVVMGVIGVATGAGSEDDTPKYPAGSLTVTEPDEGATLDTEEIVIRGTAPPEAEVRRDIRGGKKDDKFDADADGRWEYRTKLDEGENTFNFFLQDAKDVKAKLTVKYAPPVVATASPKPATRTPAPATQTVAPTAPPQTPATTPVPTAAPITYIITLRDDVSIGVCVRIVFRVRVSRPFSNEDELRRIAQEIIDDEISTNDVNAIGFFFYLPDTDTNDIYTAGKADWAPDGVWSKACDVDTGDYSSHQLGAIDSNGVLQSP